MRQLSANENLPTKTIQLVATILFSHKKKGSFFFCVFFFFLSITYIYQRFINFFGRDKEKKFKMMKRIPSAIPVVLFLLLRLMVSLFLVSIPIVDSFTVGRHSRSSIRHEQSYIPKSSLKYSLYDQDDDDDDDDDEDDDDFIDTESLGDWRTFRRNLAFEEEEEKGQQKTKEKDSTKKKPKSVSKENEQILLSQNEELAKEYITGVWAHEISTVSI